MIDSGIRSRSGGYPEASGAVLTLRATTPMFFPGELWIEAAGTAPASRVREACTGEPWVAVLAELPDWSAHVVGCSRDTPFDGLAKESIRLDVPRARAEAWRRQAGFVTPYEDTFCPPDRCWDRPGDVPARVVIDPQGPLHVVLYPDTDE